MNPSMKQRLFLIGSLAGIIAGVVARLVAEQHQQDLLGILGPVGMAAGVIAFLAMMKIIAKWE